MISVAKAKDGFPIISWESKDGSFTLSSKYAPYEEAKRLLHDQEPPQLLFIFGAGNIALIQASVEIFPQAMIFVIEKEGSILSTVLTICRKQFPDLLSLVVWLGEKDYQKRLDKLFQNHYKDLKFIPNRTEARLFPDFFVELKSEIIRLHDRKSINVATLSRFERIWLRNICKNTSAILASGALKALAGVGQDISAIIVAAGPSLAPILPALKKNQDRFYIIAVDTIYKTLLRYGIVPDMVIVVDPQKINSRYLENISPENLNRTCFIAEPAVCPMSIRDKVSNLIMFNTIFPFYAFLCSHFGDKGELDMGGSVVTTAFEVARIIGFKQTAFIGLDLAISKDSYHVPGTMYEEYWFSTVDRLSTYELKTFRLLDYFNLERIDGLDGKPVYLDARFKMFRHWLQQKMEKK